MAGRGGHGESGGAGACSACPEAGGRGAGPVTLPTSVWGHPETRGAHTGTASAAVNGSPQCGRERPPPPRTAPSTRGTFGHRAARDKPPSPWMLPFRGEGGRGRRRKGVLRQCGPEPLQEWRDGPASKWDGRLGPSLLCGLCFSHLKALLAIGKNRQKRVHFCGSLWCLRHGGSQVSSSPTQPRTRLQPPAKVKANPKPTANSKTTSAGPAHR